LSVGGTIDEHRRRSFAAACVALLACGCSTRYRGPPSAFDGSRNFNPKEKPPFSDMVNGLGDGHRALFGRSTTRHSPRLSSGLGDLRVTYVNHATVLIQIDGINILTDPIWSKYAGPTSWLGVKRVRPPGVAFEALPKIDFVLVSHDHYDHLDAPTIERLAQRDHPKFIVGSGVATRLTSIDIPARDITELDWWNEINVAGARMRIIFVPARHGSGRGPFTEACTLWGGFVIATPDEEVYFAGDTGLGAFVDEIAARFSRIRLAILPIGAYEKRWFMKTQHMNPEDAVLVHRKLRAAQSMGIHYGTFAEHPEQAIDAHEKDLAAALASQAIEPSRFWVLGFGEARSVPR
jgi:L-ascorbate metabolism protein UlaG (beta-lactamase superfamily)